MKEAKRKVEEGSLPEHIMAFAVFFAGEVRDSIVQFAESAWHVLYVSGFAFPSFSTRSTSW